MKVKNHYLNNVVFLDVASETRVWPATVNYTPGRTVYTERLFTDKGVEYRTWDPYKSKLAACLYEGLEGVPQLDTIRTLYLGAATGTTVSHVSDIIGDAGGVVYALEFSARVARRLINLSQERQNIVPIVADARKTDSYAHQVWTVDFLFQDISQIDQAKIFVNNAQAFLRPGGTGLLIIKAASIDSTREAGEVADEQVAILREAGLEVQKMVDISAFEREHRAVLVTKPTEN